MRRVYHGAYVSYLESARVEMLRSLGWEYAAMEKEGILLPVRSLNIVYHQPIEYDALIDVVTRVVKKPTVRIGFKYALYVNGELKAEAEVELVCLNQSTGRPGRLPKKLIADLGY